MRGLILLALSLPSFAQSPTLPAAPEVTVGASQLKVLQFNWTAVPGATHYQLQFKPDAASPFAPYGNPILPPRAIASVFVPVHAFDWINARYKVSACNAAGCQDSAELPVQNLMLTSIGYFKASNPDLDDAFGYRLQLSQDGNTLAVAAAEGSNATGVNGNQEDNSSTASGAVYVFRRIGAGWRQEAYLKGDVNHPYQQFGAHFMGREQSLSLSANGSVLAVGAPGEIVGSGTGAVYLFTRAANGTWSQSHKLTLGVPPDNFGISVDLSDDATLLKVTSSHGSIKSTTRVYKLVAGSWVIDTTFVADENAACMSQMSGTGVAIVYLCASGLAPARLVTTRRVGANWVRMADLPLDAALVLSSVPALSGNGARLALRMTETFGLGNRVVVYALSGNRWVPEASLPSPIYSSVFGESLAFNRNGTMLAIGDSFSGNGGAGVSDTPVPAGSALPASGAVYVFARSGSAWTFRKVVQSPNPETDDYFGRDIAISGSGLTLAVGAIGEDSAATGVDGDQGSEDAQTSGAVYLY
jgi:trimeric autotransporter adhesin